MELFTVLCLYSFLPVKPGKESYLLDVLYVKSTILWWIKLLNSSSFGNASSPSYPIKSAEYLCYHLATSLYLQAVLLWFSLYSWAHYFLFSIDVGKSTETEIIVSQTFIFNLGRYPRVTLGQRFRRFIFPPEALETSHYSDQAYSVTLISLSVIKE